MHALIIANGTQPPLTVVRPLADAADMIVCADGGANHALKMNIRPSVIIGDFDSIILSTRHYYSHIKQIIDPDQNSTDLEKAIQYCIDQRIDSADIVGATGSRLDHSTGSLGCFKKFGNRIRLRLFDTVAQVQSVDRSITFDVDIGETISLIPLERCSGVNTTNLKYALSGESLELGVREGISNVTIASPVTVSVEVGTLLLYRFYRR